MSTGTQIKVLPISLLAALNHTAGPNIIIGCIEPHCWGLISPLAALNHTAGPNIKGGEGGPK